jgi:hypothetical protein
VSLSTKGRDDRGGQIVELVSLPTALCVNESNSKHSWSESPFASKVNLSTLPFTSSSVPIVISQARPASFAYVSLPPLRSHPFLILALLPSGAICHHQSVCGKKQRSGSKHLSQQQQQLQQRRRADQSFNSNHQGS